MLRLKALLRSHARLTGVFFATLILAACSGGGGGGGADPAPNQPPPPVALTSAGLAIVKTRATATNWVVMAERLKVLQDIRRPDRRLAISPDGTAQNNAIFEPPAGWVLNDFALHPSQQVTAVLVNDRMLRLVRLSRTGQVLAQLDLTDPDVLTDPFMDDPIYIRDRGAMVPYYSRDAARVEALGEDFVIALRTGHNAVVAYRYRMAAGGFDRTWRTLVEPGVVIGFNGLTSGTYDPFGSSHNQWHVFLDVSPAGRIAVAVDTYRTDLVAGHAAHFGENLPESFSGALVTTLSANGQREGTALIAAQRATNVHTVRWSGNNVAVAGRNYTEFRADGSGWNAFVSVMAVTQSGPGTPSFQLVDINRGDIILDLAPLANGRWLAAGSTGYTQNPGGASVSEEAVPLLAVLEANGQLRQTVSFTAGPRQNQIRSLTSWRGGWLLGGLTNGPGTHSADGNPALLTADGYLRESTIALP